MPSTGGTTETGCDNCGRPGDALEAVRRVYVTVDGDGRVTGSETVTGVEEWCLACRTLYPHEPAGAGPGGPAPSDEPSGDDGSS